MLTVFGMAGYYCYGKSENEGQLKKFVGQSAADCYAFSQQEALQSRRRVLLYPGDAAPLNV